MNELLPYNGHFNGHKFRVFQDSLHSFYILGFNNIEINAFGEKIVLGGCLSNWSAGVYKLIQVT